MSVTWPIVKSWIERNSFQTAALSPYISAHETIQGARDVEEEAGWVRTPVSPATPLSAVLLSQDTVYGASLVNGRYSLLRDELTDLQEKAMIHFKSRAWPVRKTAEGLAAAGIEEGRASSWPAIGWRAICALRECQIVVINEDKKHISFYPEDVRTWSSEIEVIYVEYEARYIWTASKGHSLSKWLSDKDFAKWTIEWPLADGTMEELKASAIKHNQNIPPKTNKESLRARVGRAESISTFANWLSDTYKT